ncbi:MAG TPA: hypothetical protein VH988_28370, partial [Thermoanaerobaculia bacterium]|nr:hypothetical protein [Thermoanaerobaculia bacterium]
MVWIIALGIGLDGCGAPAPGPPASPLPSLAAGVQPGTLELRRWQAPAERVVIEPGGIALGAAGSPLVHYLFVSPDRAQDLQTFVRSYAPFRNATERGEMAFGGRGTSPAGPAEQRMIVEWARLVAAEVTAGRSGGSYGLIFAWHRGGAVGSCDDLAVFLTGEVRASSCGWGDEVRGRLAVEPLGRLYAWFDGLTPFQEGSEESSGESRDSSRLVFAGQGRQPATPGEIAALRALAPELHRELAARRPGATAAPAEEGEASPERLLVPPEAAAAGRPSAAIPAEVVVPPAPSPTLPRASTALPPRAGEG